MNKKYESPVIEIIEYTVNICTSNESSDINNPTEGSGSTGWLPWI